MIARSLTAVLTGALIVSSPASAQEALVAYKSMSPETALELARAALADRRHLHAD